MYAVVGKWKMDPSLTTDQDTVLRERIVQNVKSSPGFVSGHWTRTTDATDAISFITFEDQGSAEAFLEVVNSNSENRSAHGVQNDFLVVAEVMATA